MIDLNSPTVRRVLERFGIDDIDARGAVEAYEMARQAFDRFAGLDAPELPSGTVDALQVRLVRWQTANFGVARAYQLALGVAEEFGELAAASTKAETVDAIGDVLIYACQMATLHRLAFVEAIDGDTFAMRVPQGAAPGLLAHVTLKADQRIRGLDDPELARFATFLALVAVVDEVRCFDADPVECFTSTARIVMERNWRADAVTGGAA